MSQDHTIIIVQTCWRSVLPFSRRSDRTRAKDLSPRDATFLLRYKNNNHTFHAQHWSYARSSPTCLYPCMRQNRTTKSHCLHIIITFVISLCNKTFKRLVCVHISKYSAIVTILFFFFTKEPNVFLYLIAPNFCMASTRLATVAPNKSRTRTTTEGSGTVNPCVNTDKQVHWLIDWLMHGLEYMF